MPIILFLALLNFLASAIYHAAEAQQPTHAPRIGFLTGPPLSAQSARTDAFRQGLRDLGYVEGKNIVIEWRSAEGNLDRMPTLAAELVQLKVDVIVTAGSRATRATKAATVTIPIVMAQVGDPLANRFVASLARPGGNITGLSTLAPELSGKRLEILKEVVPKLSRVAVVGTSTSPSNAQVFKEIEIAAGAFGVTLQYLDVLTARDIESALRAASKGQADAVLEMVSGFIRDGQRKEIAALAIKSRLPLMHERGEHVEAGGLMSDGVSLPDLFRRAATYVDKILKGRKPAALPVELPIKFEFVINLKTAKQIGLTIPPNVLARADRIIR
ncbi:MAG TPA: ABC transporter substrate-binding protein [Candidatus Binatia bacterium]|nr:ABC transporter substrate-binding protein [Candidatus Binatia bacterium]